MTEFCTKCDAKVVPDVRIPHTLVQYLLPFARMRPDARVAFTLSAGGWRGTGGGGRQPYYGGADGFENVLDLLDDACDGLLKSL